MLSQRRAAEIWGVSRRTIQRAIQSGKMSVNGEGRIDPSEMLRVFGPASGQVPTGASAPQEEPLAPPHAHTQTNDLQQEITRLRAALVAKDELLAAKDRHIEDMSLSLRLLAAPQPPAQQPEVTATENSATSQSFWGRFRRVDGKRQ